MIIIELLFAQTVLVDTSKLKVYVGLCAPDTMSVNDFIKYGKVEVNVPGLQVRSFTLGLTGIDCNGCEMETEHFHNNILTVHGFLKLSTQ